ncbi:MAG: restriction endonuclease subunit S [Prolixibacteraceae bacterium]|nr:restriction endonuclease subunit S [Prolixibacteraceae bacterium]
MDKLPKGWFLKRLEEVAAYQKKQGLFDLPYVGMEHIESKTAVFIGKLQPQRVKSSTFSFTQDDVLYGRLRPYLCKVLAPDFFGHCSTEIFPIRVKQGLDRQFLKYWLLSDNTTKEIESTCSGSRMPRADMNKVQKIQIPLPPLSEQTRIVSKLDALFTCIDKSIALLEENINHTKGLMASVLEEVFENGKDWKKEPLNKVAKVERGKSKHRPRNDQKLFGDSYPFIQTGDVRSANKYIDKYEVCYSEFGLKQSRLWNKGTICLTIAANIGDVAILGFDACFPDSVVGITPNSMNNEFLYYYLKTLQLQLDKKANSAAQKNINLKILSEIDVPVPSIEIQNSFADRFSRLEEKQFQILSAQQSKLTYLKALKSSLLDRAFKGEL